MHGYKALAYHDSCLLLITLERISFEKFTFPSYTVEIGYPELLAQLREDWEGYRPSAKRPLPLVKPSTEYRTAIQCQPQFSLLASTATYHYFLTLSTNHAESIEYQPCQNATMHILSEPDVAQIFRSLTQAKCHDFIEALSKALVSISAESKPDVPASEKLIHQPLRTVFATKAGNSCIFMPVSDTASTAVKVVTVASGGIQGVINVFTPEGRLQGLLAAAEVTAFRTALASMTLFVQCASLRKENVLVFGSGRQAEWHARLALLLYPDQIKRVTFINRGRSRLEEMEGVVLSDLRKRYPTLLLATLAKEGNPDYDAKLLEELQACDVIFSCTPSVEPNFSFSALRSAPKQRFISLIGSYKPHMHEIDTETLLSGGGTVYVDSKSACLEESGELITAKVTEEQLTEMGDLLGELGPAQGIEVPEGKNVVYKCVGMGLMDLVVGKKVLDVGSEMGLGTHVDGF